MNYDTYLGLHAPDRAAQDAMIQQRRELLARLGLDEPKRSTVFDSFAATTAAAFATELGDVADGLYAMVNLISDQQRFVGLHNPPGKRPVGRAMRRDHGYCPEVADRGRALVLPDVCAAPRFASNHVVDAVGIRTYAGAPLLHQDVCFGTLCVIGTERMPEDTAETSLALIKQHSAQLMDLIDTHAQTDRQPSR